MKKLYFLTALAFTSTVSFSQDRNVKAHMSAIVHNPQGEFNQNVQSNASGISLGFLTNKGGLLTTGADLGVAMYSNNSYDVNYQGSTAHIYEEDCFWTMNYLVQLTPIKTFLFEGYIEGNVGISWFFSEKHASNPEFDELNAFKWHGLAANTGIGGGARFNLSGLFGPNSMNKNRYWLDVSYTVKAGSNAAYRYTTERTSTFNEGRFRSFTSYNTLKIGLQLSF